MDNFRTSRTSGVERAQKTLASSHRTEGTHLHSKSLAATEGSRRQAARDSLVAARARSRWARRPAAEAIAASMSPSRSTVWPLPVSSGSAVHGITSAWIPAASMGPAGNEQGQDADPPVHAVRAQDALQLDGLRAPPGLYAHADKRAFK
jgi:hypothetical protein